MGQTLIVVNLRISVVVRRGIGIDKTQRSTGELQCTIAHHILVPPRTEFGREILVDGLHGCPIPPQDLLEL